MHKRWYFILTLLGLYHLNCLTFELAGVPFAEPSLVTDTELREKFGEQLPPDFYRAFAKAVEWQKHNQSLKAWAMYNILLNNLELYPDLYGNVQEYINYNLSLMS